MSTDGVHRLVDMVVEEVSLVDRAANNHRFLIVKRDAMADDTTPAEKAAETEVAVATDSPLGTAMAALESLTAIVDLLGDLGETATNDRLASLATQLRATADTLLQRTEAGEATVVVEARAPQADLTAAKAALEKLATIAATALRRPESTPAPAPAPPPNTGLDVAIAKLSASMRDLQGAVKEQQQRLGRVEKQFGLPASVAADERVTKTATETVSWPLDLNRPLDRASVDKSTSFHDR